ncbi:hypothetical protein SAM23877_1608 [Streptomyces ambofaciens ATCC 23877]|uniref:Uncharacterized protein n=1 Tax=Streptomyces ambofaciens (strain ATCC 23877 / 3486 / DSM 40053 / JCM 4204 / NBRC 12836 / NRRL B-2516) TaxID=278992 RepID=A0A0K2AP93_STRA7|nr:hypothetical protein SAM23877_1608 [Streptomyces ambofaciens ATCC 23877]
MRVGSSCWRCGGRYGGGAALTWGYVRILGDVRGRHEAGPAYGGGRRRAPAAPPLPGAATSR